MAFDFEEDFDLDAEDSNNSTATTEDISSESDVSVDYYTEEDFRARGVNPQTPTAAKPGTEDKVLMLAARYAAGLPLWHDSDCYDHGPALEQHA